MQQTFELALRHHQAGRLADAEPLYRQVLAAAPRHADSLHLLGILSCQTGRPDAAAALISQAIAITGAQPFYLNDLANVLQDQGRLDEADRRYSEALRLKPDFVDALYNLGTVLHRQGRLDEAIARYGEALHLKPDCPDTLCSLGNALQDHGRPDAAIARYTAALRLRPADPDALCNLGKALHGQGRLTEAMARYSEALRLKPDHHHALNNLGMAFKDQGRLGEAIARYAEALRVKPDYHHALYNLGNALQSQGRLSEAIARYTEALRLKPDYPEALCNLGIALQNQGRWTEAVAKYREALHLKPDYPDALCNLGIALHDQGRLEDSIARYTEALCLQPDCRQALNNLGIALKDQGRLAEAIACTGKALRLKPDYHQAHSNLLFCRNLDPAIDDETLFRAHLDWDERHGKPLAAAAARHANRPDPHRPLRIGYVSGNFGQHPVGWFLAAVWAAHDREAAVLHAYSDRTVEDDFTRRLKQHAAVWRPVKGVPDGLLAEQIRADGIDILVDLDGHTAGSRLPVFARRPAPVQVSWLGYWQTTGLSAMDAVIMDAVTLPPGGERCFAEQVVRLPEGRFCYAPPEYAPAVVAPPCTGGQPVRFGSFNNTAKLNDAVLALWARVLAAVPGSRLVLKWKSLAEETHRARLRDAFRAAGGDDGRLELRGASPHPQLLAEYGDIDIALDPFPFCGGLTSCEALWMGVPVLTLPGARPVSRQTLGFLTTLGLERDMAAATADAYVVQAAELAASPHRLAALRAGLREHMRRSPLCDGPRFARHLEGLYRTLWARWCAGQPPPDGLLARPLPSP